MDGEAKLAARRRAGLAWLAAVLLGFWATGGCGGSAGDSPDELDPEHYGKLPGLSSTPLPGLRDELARIAEEGGTPELLSAGGVADEQNVAAGLKDLFESEKIGSILKEANEIYYPPRKAGFDFDPVRLERAVAFRKTYDPQRQRARIALRRPQCDFGIAHTAGQFADLSCVDMAWILSRLEAFQAAEQLQVGELDAAIQSLGYLLRLAQCLGAEKHMVARGQAAKMLSEALLLLDAIVRHPKVTRAHLEELFGLIEAQLAKWPDDADAWIGDRASGMHFYEMVRDGKLMALLLAEDIDRLGGAEVARDVPKAARRTVNEDELYYLRTMRKIIESCRQPYFRRAALFEAIRGDLQLKQGTSEFPLVAGHLLLPDIESVHLIQAEDRAICEAWSLALALATGKERPPYKINPRTGSPYKVLREDGRVEVSQIGPDGDDTRLAVPDLSGRE